MSDVAAVPRQSTEQLTGGRSTTQLEPPKSSSPTERPNSAARKVTSIGYYELEKSVGEGNFAKVKLATHTLTGQKVYSFGCRQ